MARKGQKFKTYSKEFKMEIVHEYLEGSSGGDTLSKKYSIPKSSIKSWIRKYRMKGEEGFDTDNRGKGSTGRPKIDKVDYDSMTDKEKIEYLEMEVAILKKLKAIQKGKQQ